MLPTVSLALLEFLATVDSQIRTQKPTIHVSISAKFMEESYDAEVLTNALCIQGMDELSEGHMRYVWS